MPQGIATRIREAREACGWTQEGLAWRAGTAVRTVVRIEAGEDARISTVAQVAEALGIALEIGEAS